MLFRTTFWEEAALILADFVWRILWINWKIEELRTKSNIWQSEKHAKFRLQLHVAIYTLLIRLPHKSKNICLTKVCNVCLRVRSPRHTKAAGNQRVEPVSTSMVIIGTSCSKKKQNVSRSNLKKCWALLALQTKNCAFQFLVNCNSFVFFVQVITLPDPFNWTNWMWSGKPSLLP